MIVFAQQGVLVGGWEYIYAAYAATWLTLGGYALVLAVRNDPGARWHAWLTRGRANGIGVAGNLALGIVIVFLASNGQAGLIGTQSSGALFVLGLAQIAFALWRATTLLKPLSSEETP